MTTQSDDMFVITDAMVERLGRYLRDVGVVHRTPPTSWEQMMPAQRRQWLELAREYLEQARGAA